MRALATRALVLLACVVAGVGSTTTHAGAAFSSARDAGVTQLRTLQLAAPASVTATTTDACTTVSIGWDRAAGATAYRIDVRVDAGAWTPLATTGDVAGWVDSTGRAGVVVAYRVFSRHAGSGWESATPAASPQLACGVLPVVDVVATNSCSSTVLAWTTPAGATTFDVQRRVNGGSWVSLATDQLATSHTDATLHPAAATVDYQVRSGDASGANGAWSPSATIGSWQPFRVVSIVVANSGALGTLNVGDTITVTFSKPVATGTVSPSVVVDHAGGDRGLYLGTSAAGAGGVGRSTTAPSTFGATASYSGSSAWGDGDATWTWRSGVAGTTMSALSGTETWSPGSGVRCAGDNSGLVSSASSPAISGRW